MANKLWVGTDTGNEGNWSVAANWSPSGVPVNSDDVFLEFSSQDVDSGLAQAAVALATLNIAKSYTGKVGTSSAYLNIGAATVNIGQHNGPGTPAGSGRIKLDLDDTAATAATANVYNTGATADTGLPAVRLLFDSASAELNVYKGTVGVAVEAGETDTLGVVNASYVSQVSSDADVFIGPGVTLTTANQTGGDLVLECGVTTVTASAGTLKTSGSGAIATLNVSGGTTTSNSSGTITAANVTGGFLDLTKSAESRTITTLKLDAPGKVKFDPNIVTLTNQIQPYSSSGVITYMAAR